MPDGVMEWKVCNDKCQGFENFKTIEIQYAFPNGTRKGCGTKYSGTRRCAFVPASPEGIVVFKMLVEAFRRKLSFVVGTSLTTGQKNTVVWSGIHHKTSIWGGAFGYPDPTYFGRVSEELKVRDIDAETVKNDSTNINSGLISIRGDTIIEP